MKTLLLILPLSISLSAFGQIKTNGSRGGTVKNSPAPTVHRPAVRVRRPVSHSTTNAVSPARTRPSSGSSNTGNFSSSSSSSSSSSNTYYNSNGRSEYGNSGSSNNYVAPEQLEGYSNLADPTGGDFVKTHPNNLINTLLKQIERYAVDSTDIMILIDVSGSMGNNIEEIYSESDAIIVSVPSGSRIGAASFRIVNSPNWYDHSDLSEDHWNAMDFIGEKRKYYNSESHYDAIYKTVNTSSWINNKRMIITITDEYIAPKENITTGPIAIEAAKSKNVALHTILLQE